MFDWNRFTGERCGINVFKVLRTIVRSTYDPPQGVDTEGDLGDVLPLPEVHGLEHLVDRDAIFFGGFLETLDVLHQREPSSFLIDLLDTSGHQFVHQAETTKKENDILMATKAL